MEKSLSLLMKFLLEELGKPPFSEHLGVLLNFFMGQYRLAFVCIVLIVNIVDHCLENFDFFGSWPGRGEFLFRSFGWRHSGKELREKVL